MILANVCYLGGDGLSDIDFRGQHSYRQLSGRWYQCSLQKRRGVLWIIGITRTIGRVTATAVTVAIVFVLKVAVASVIVFEIGHAHGS